MEWRAPSNVDFALISMSSNSPVIGSALRAREQRVRSDRLPHTLVSGVRLVERCRVQIMEVCRISATDDRERAASLTTSKRSYWRRGRRCVVHGRVQAAQSTDASARLPIRTHPSRRSGGHGEGVAEDDLMGLAGIVDDGIQRHACLPAFRDGHQWARSCSPRRPPVLLAS
jgi:hypothetical protein